VKMLLARPSNAVHFQATGCALLYAVVARYTPSSDTCRARPKSDILQV
jgi:hypothetical protein